ncbi:hypothetical protein Dip510_001498 [Elusimicrobium posterum]|uniref:hypothetical protein n=1 Tax=Elusimicrobium posterum TaxID=3116653 RepID=UPI003C71F26E
MKKYKAHIVGFIILLLVMLALIFAEQITLMLGYPSNEIALPSQEVVTQQMQLKAD